MQLKSLSISNLFGAFSYSIDFQSVSQPFLITGPNGYGKTTILTIIDNIAKKNLIYFFQLPFERIALGFDNSQMLSIQAKIVSVEEKAEKDAILEGEKEIAFEWTNEGALISTFVLNKNLIRKAARNIGYYSGRRLETYDFNSDSFLSFVGSNDRFYDIIAKELGQTTFLMLLSNLSSTFIKAQRINFDAEKNESSIEGVVANLKSILRNDQFNYLTDAERHDNAFIDKLLSSSIRYSKTEYEALAKEMEVSIGELKRFGLINSFKLPEYTEGKAEILTAYVNDVREKLVNYKATIEKLRLFSALLEKKKFVNKSVSYSPAFGLRVRSNQGGLINVNKLSSGEQNEIIMLYNFIYNVSDNSILLVDEPENSLHVVWQEEFINDIEEIAKAKKMQVIIATHSPQILGSKWKDSYDLYENNTQR